MTFFVFAWGIWGCCTLAFAQDEGEPMEVQLNQNGRFVNGGIDDSNFDRWVFGNVQKREDARNSLEAKVDLRLEELKQICGLTEAQINKLRLASRGDLKRFFEKFDAARRHFQKIKNEPNGVNESFQEIRPLQTEFQSGLFNEGSMFKNSLSATWTAEQSAKWQIAETARRKFRERAALEMALVTFEENIPLQDKQRQALLKLILEQPPGDAPPAMPGRAVAVRDVGQIQFGQPNLAQKLAMLPQDQLQTIFDAYQLVAVEKMVKPYRPVGLQGVLGAAMRKLKKFKPEDFENPNEAAKAEKQDK